VRFYESFGASACVHVRSISVLSAVAKNPRAPDARDPLQEFLSSDEVEVSDLHLFHLEVCAVRCLRGRIAIRFSSRLIGAGANFQSGHERANRRLGNEHECKYFPVAACLLRNERERVYISSSRAG